MSMRTIRARRGSQQAWVAAVLLVAATGHSGATRAGAQGVARAEPAPRDTAPLVTDRPDFTEAAVPVPRGALQLETGAIY